MASKVVWICQDIYGLSVIKSSFIWYLVFFTYNVLHVAWTFSIGISIIPSVQNFFDVLRFKNYPKKLDVLAPEQ
jgi:hypothetical protein